MAGEVERFIRIQTRAGLRSNGRAGAASWRTLPNCEKVPVWEYLTLLLPNEETGLEEKRYIFHVRFIDGLRKGARVTWLGGHFTVLGVSDSKRLVGLELSCVPEQMAADDGAASP